jgi:SAM-dependent methyltransferase
VSEGHIANRLAAEALAAGDPTGWYEPLYAAARDGGTTVPWDRGAPQDLLVGWARERGAAGAGRRAVVVGCGLGDDAEFAAGLGFDTVAFDISASAIELARRRFPGSDVRYVRADLLAAPPAWSGAFDLVIEVQTVQALPEPDRSRAIAAVAGLTAPGGTLLVVTAAGDAQDPRSPVPPWPLARAEIDAFATGGLAPVRVEDVRDAAAGRRRWRAEFHRAAAPPR